MLKKIYFPMTLVAVAILAGCAAPKNASLTEAHSNYNRAATNPQVTTLAALELKDAGDTLNKADDALSKGESTNTVDHLAYKSNRQTAIAQETANRKAAELAVSNAAINRDKMRLEARTAEVDAARQQVAISQNTVDQQALALSAAGAKSERDRAYILHQETLMKELKAQKTKRGMVITLGDVLFSTNKSTLRSGATHNMQKLADFLKEYPQQKVMVEGYTDSTGSKLHNQKLSERRADAVRTALVDMGVSSDRVTTQGYGEAFPVASNKAAGSRQMNRRVEIIFSDDNGNFIPR